MRRERKHFLVRPSVAWLFLLSIVEFVTFTLSVLLRQHDEISFLLKGGTIFIGYVIFINVKERGKNNGRR